MSKAMQFVNQLYNDPGVSLWVKIMLKSCLGRDVHEVAAEVKMLSDALAAVAAEHVGEAGALVKDEESPCAVVIALDEFKRRSR